jgi:hypothetical protein
MVSRLRVISRIQLAPDRNGRGPPAVPAAIGCGFRVTPSANRPDHPHDHPHAPSESDTELESECFLVLVMLKTVSLSLLFLITLGLFVAAYATLPT